jgi:hypothetical protein
MIFVGYSSKCVHLKLCMFKSVTMILIFRKCILMASEMYEIISFFYIK